MPKLIKGINDLATKNPFLAKEWHPTKNGNLMPDMIFPNCHNKVWWLCPFGHEYEATPLHRNAGTGCPICFSEKQTSFPEQALFYYLVKHFNNVKNRYLLDGVEFDIYIPNLKTAIEYDGAFYHKLEKLKKDNQKNKFALKKKINLIRIVESNQNLSKFLFIDKKNVFHLNPRKKYKALEEWIRNFIKVHSEKEVDICIDFDKDYEKILSQYIKSIKEKSLKKIYPDIAKEWHPTNNKLIKPDMVLSHSNHKFWWKCEKGHEYQATVNNRVNGLGCPFCSGAKPLKGFNSLGDVFPISIKYWDFDKNKLTPFDYLPSSNLKVFWKCPDCGYKFKKSINKMNRSYKINSTGCPVCSKRVTISGINDFKTNYPQLALEWDYENNKTDLPENYSKTSVKPVWWKCSKCGQSWMAPINKRIFANNKCPYCSSKMLKYKKGVSDLATRNKKEIKDWDYEKNTSCPSDFTSKSHKQVYWKCKQGHSYLQPINVHVQKKCGCPYCSGHRVLAGFNDLMTTNPEIIKFWDYEKNKINASSLSKGSHIKIHWKCSICGNVWNEAVYNMVKRGECPNCLKKKLIKSKVKR